MLRVVDKTPPEDSATPVADAVRARQAVLSGEGVRKAMGALPLTEEGCIEDLAIAYGIARDRAEWTEKFLSLVFENCVMFLFYTKDGEYRGRVVYEGEGHLEWQNRTLEPAAEMAGGILFGELEDGISP